MAEQYVGIDLHRRRMVIVRKDTEGRMVDAPVRIENDPMLVAAELAKAGPDPEVVVEATYGWYWLVDLLGEQCGATVHLAHPLGLNWGQRRRKDDVVDASDLVDLLRLGRLPEAWIAPAEIRESRELVRYRAKLVALPPGAQGAGAFGVGQGGGGGADDRPFWGGWQPAAGHRRLWVRRTPSGWSRCGI